MQEATPVVDKDLLGAVIPAAKLCGTTTQFGIGKDIGIVRRATSPPTMRDVTASLHGSPTTS